MSGLYSYCRHHQGIPSQFHTKASLFSRLAYGVPLYRFSDYCLNNFGVFSPVFSRLFWISCGFYIQKDDIQLCWELPPADQESSKEKYFFHQFLFWNEQVHKMKIIFTEKSKKRALFLEILCHLQLDIQSKWSNNQWATATKFSKGNYVINPSLRLHVNS